MIGTVRLISGHNNNLSSLYIETHQLNKTNPMLKQLVIAKNVQNPIKLYSNDTALDTLRFIFKWHLAIKTQYAVTCF